MKNEINIEMKKKGGKNERLVKKKSTKNAASLLISFTTAASASGLAPFSINVTQIANVSLSSPVFNKLEISCNAKIFDKIFKN